MERDYEAEDALNRMGRWRQVWFVTCQKLLENREFTGLMQKLLKTLEQVYGNPVDIEYTVNIDEEGDLCGEPSSVPASIYGKQRGKSGNSQSFRGKDIFPSEGFLGRQFPEKTDPCGYTDRAEIIL